MFNKKKIRKLEKKVNKFEKWFDNIEKIFDSIDNELNNIVFCEDCGVAIHRDEAQKVEYYNTRYYCQKHKKPYDKISSNATINYKDNVIEYDTKYYKSNVEVDKKGKPIK